jgi:twitching motility protein PilT
VARLDPLLKALVEKKAEELVLAKGCRPSFRFGDQLHPVSRQPLGEDQITSLLAEVSDQIQPGAAGAPTGRFPCSRDGVAFICDIQNGSGGLRATLRHAVAQPRAAVAEPAAAPITPPARQPRPGAPEIERFLLEMVELGASDLHLSADETPMVRIDGEMTRMPAATVLEAERTKEMLAAIMPEHNAEEYRQTHDTDFAYEIEGVSRFRVNVFTDRKGTGAVFRTIPEEVLTADQLGLPDSALGLCDLTKGLVLVTGPTGSGKSTTLAAMIDHVNRSRTDHIITIEDPIEFVHRNQKCLINQREVHNHTDGFKKALRAALREDPDIVLVGEMRDLETIAMAIETAETGHLVFGTLHTTSACSTVDRIIDQFPADRQAQIRAMLSESLRGVISQTLLKRNAGGRVAALEILIVTTAISNLIREGKTFQIPSLMQTGKKHGIRLMNDALSDLVRRKVVDPQEAYRKAIDKNGLVSQLRAAGIQLKAAIES